MHRNIFPHACIKNKLYGMLEEKRVQINIPVTLYDQIEMWRSELSYDYQLANLEPETFINLLLSRAHMDVAIMIWNPTEGVIALKDFKRKNEN